jgi:hypothetical protein
VVSFPTFTRLWSLPTPRKTPETEREQTQLICQVIKSPGPRQNPVCLLPRQSTCNF